MLSVLYAVLALALVIGSAFGVAEYRSYSASQRARAPLLSRLFLGVVIAMGGTGAGGLVWIASGGSVWAVGGILAIVAALPCLVQALMHREMDVDRSPFAERVGRRIARKFNVPEH